MPAHDHVEARHGLGDADIGGQAHMGQADDDVHAFGGQRVDIFLQRFDLIHEDDVFAGRGDFLRVRGQRRDDADLNAVHIEDQRVADAPGKRGFRADVEVAGDDREGHRVQERHDTFGAVVELVVAQRHGVEADGLHELPGGGAVIGREKQAALVLVARIEDDDVLARCCKFVAQVVDRGGNTRHAAKAFARRVILGIAGRIETADRLDTAVQIVDMQDVEGRVGRHRRSHREARQDRGRSQDT
jgi:hypothetical protein